MLDVIKAIIGGAVIFAIVAFFIYVGTVIFLLLSGIVVVAICCFVGWFLINCVIEYWQEGRG